MKEVNACIITIGDELLIGQTVDTNSAFIAQQLNAIGIWVRRRIAVGDVKEEILSALTSQASDNDVIILTGGLGPTDDDITKPVLCEYFGSALVVNERALQNVKDIFTKLNRPLIERNLRQAEVPDNCTVLPNTRGTAPGMWFEKDSLVVVSLPGVPHEMKGLMQRSVIPRLQKRLALPAVMHRTLVTSGVGESTIAEHLADYEKQLPSPIKLAYLPAYGVVRLRLTARGSDRAGVEKQLQQQFDSLRQLVHVWMVAERDTTLQQALIDLLTQQGKTLSTAESCTGGYIAHLITSIPGSSAVYKGTVVSYSNEVKEQLLGVQGDTLQLHGAVSEQTVMEMVHGVRKRLDTDYAIATSGIMGPTGGSAEKPVGTVWIAVASRGHARATRHFFRFDRERNIEMAAQTALTLMRKLVAEDAALNG